MADSSAPPWAEGEVPYDDDAVTESEVNALEEQLAALRKEDSSSPNTSPPMFTPRRKVSSKQDLQKLEEKAKKQEAQLAKQAEAAAKKAAAEAAKKQAAEEAAARKKAEQQAKQAEAIAKQAEAAAKKAAAATKQATEGQPSIAGSCASGDAMHYSADNKTLASGNKLVYGQLGEVIGPDPNDADRVTMKFPGNPGIVACLVTQLSKEPPVRAGWRGVGWVGGRGGNGSALSRDLGPYAWDFGGRLGRGGRGGVKEVLGSPDVNPLWQAMTSQQKAALAQREAEVRSDMHEAEV